MAELFPESGQSEDVALSSPQMQGLFFPAIDNPNAADGLGIVTPWGSGSTARRYLDYGPSAEASPGDTNLRDSLNSLLYPGAAGGITYNLEGLVGPQGPPGPPGPSGVSVSGFGFPSPAGLFDISNSLKQIEDLGTKIDQMIYTSAFEYTYTWTNKGIPSGSDSARATFVETNEDMSIIYNAQSYWNIYKSIDYGDNWTDITPPGMAGKIASSVSCDNTGNIVVVTFQNNEHVWISTDAGATWTQRYPVAPGPSTNYFCSAVSHDGTVIYVGDYGKRLWKTTNNGVNWTEIRPAGDANKGWRGISCNETGARVVAVNETDTTKIYVSSDGGTTWSSATTVTTTIWKETACNESGRIMIAVGQVNIVYVSTDYGVTWSRLLPFGAGSNIYWNSVDVSDLGGVILLCGFVVVGGTTYYNVALSSFNNGTTWTTEFYVLAGTAASALVFESAAIAGTGTRGVVSRDTKNSNLPVYTSTSYGTVTWAETTITPFARTLVDDYTAADARTTLGLGSGDSPTFAGLTLTGKTGVLWANAGVITSDATLDLIGSLAANKTFNNGAFSVSFNFTNPTNQPTYDGAFEIQASGAFAGDLFHVHQHTGNPGVTDLCHFEAEDADVTVLRLQHDMAGASCLEVGAVGSVKAKIFDSGFAVLGHTALNSSVLRLNNSTDVCRLIFDVEGLAGAGRQAWAFQTDRNVNGDFTLLRGAVGATPGTVVLYSDNNGNIGVGKYTPGTLLDVNGVITATGGDSTNWNTAYGWGNHALAGYLTSPVAIANGGTGQTSAQAAIDALTQVAGATNEHVLTKDTVTGNAIWKASGAGYTDEQAQDAIGAMLADTATINLTYTDATPELKADLDSTLKSNYDAAFTHKSNNGTDHSYINQSIKTTDSPSFIGLLCTDAELTNPVTTYGTATSYLKIEPDSASDGGARIWGFSDAAGQRALALFGVVGVADPTDTTPCIDLVGGKSDGGTSVAVIGNDETLFQVENWGTAKFKVFGDGDVTLGDINSLNSSLNLRTGGNNRLVINSAGIISYPVQSGAGASKTSAQAIDTATWTKVQFETENYDYQNEYDPSTNYRFTATVAGLYLVSALVNINEVADGKLVYVGLKRNGSFIAISPPAHSSATAAGGQFFTLVVPLAATEYLEIWVYHTVGVTKNVAGNGESFVSYAKIA